MVEETRSPKKPEKSAVELAVAALEGSPNPMDMDMRDIDPSPTSLDLTLPHKPDDRPDAAGPGHTGGRAKKRVGSPLNATN